MQIVLQDLGFSSFVYVLRSGIIESGGNSLLIVGETALLSRASVLF